MFTKSFTKTSSWDACNGKAFPKGIVEAARQKYNQKVLEKGSKTVAKAVVPEPAKKLKFIQVEEALLKKLLSKGK